MDETYQSVASRDPERFSASASHAASLVRASRVLRRRWPLLFATAVVVCGLSLLFSFRQQTLYSASTEVYLSQQNLADALNGIPSNNVYDTATLQRVAATQATIADTLPVAAEALSAVTGAHLSPKALLANTQISPSVNADILNFSVTNHEPQLAVLLVNALSSAYISYRLRIDGRAITLARSKLAAYLVQLTKTGQSNSSLYSSLVSKSALLQSLQALDTANATIVQGAVSASQVQPRTVRNAAIGLLLGLVLGIGFMVARETFDTRLRSENDVAGELDLPLVGRVGPPPRRLRSTGAQAIMLADPRHSTAEAYRLLRANLDLSLLRSKVLLVTSAVEGEGKSTTAANLAVAWARIGKRVLVLDLDLRRPRQASLLGCDARYGMTDVIRETVDLDSAIQDVSFSPGAPSAAGTNGALFCLSPGPAPSNVGELLALTELDDIVTGLRAARRVDLIVIDSPPAVIYSDAASLARVADALLTVARVGFLHRSSARELRRITAQWDLRRIGFVLTGLPEKSSRYGYAYGYGYRQSGQGKHQADEETWPPYTGGDTTEPVGADPYSSRGQLQ